MRTLAALLLAVVLAAGFTPATALAANCNAAAQAVCAQYGCNRIISVQDQGSACSVTIQIPGANGQPPRVITVQA